MSKSSDKVRVGVIGTGAISGAYLGMAKNFPIVEMAACADLDLNAAKKKADEFGIPKVCSVDELLADKGDRCHFESDGAQGAVPIALRTIEAGKHTYAEKPLGIDRTEAKKMLDAAAARKLRSRLHAPTRSWALAFKPRGR